MLYHAFTPTQRTRNPQNARFRRCLIAALVLIISAASSGSDSEGAPPPGLPPSTAPPPSSAASPSPALAASCGEASWPSLDTVWFNGVCGQCKVLVDNFDSRFNRTCANYCAHVSQVTGVTMACTGAWEDAPGADSCNVLRVEDCNAPFQSDPDTTDGICECHPSTGPNAIPAPSSPGPATLCEDVPGWVDSEGDSCATCKQSCLALTNISQCT